MIKTTSKKSEYKEFFNTIDSMPVDFTDISYYRVIKITKDTIEKETEFKSLVSFEKIEVKKHVRYA